MKRSVARGLFGGVAVVLCAGFVPTGGCAKACGKSADDVARTGDDVAIRNMPRDMPHYTPPRTPMMIPGAGVGDDLGGLSKAGLDDAVATLPEVEGSVGKLATASSPSGATIRFDPKQRTFGRDYARSVDDLKLTKEQHGELIDAFEIAQEFIEPGVDALLSLAEDDDDDARRLVHRASKDLDVKLRAVLTPEQYDRFESTLGTPDVVAYRIAVEKPIVADR